MPLNIELGLGAPGADAYLGVPAFKAYCAGVGYSISASTDQQIEEAIRRGTTYIDGRYRKRFPSGRWESTFSGSKKNGRQQGLEWPRKDAVDYAGESIADDAIPVEVFTAAAEATYRELVTPGSLSPDFVATSLIKSEKLGPLETTFAVPDASAPGAAPTRPVITLIDEIIAPVLVARYELPAMVVV